MPTPNDIELALEQLVLELKQDQLVQETNLAQPQAWTMDQNAIQLAARAIASAETILITAGAGIGVDSGLPDFRGNQGFWKIHPNYAEEGLTFSALANPRWFESAPYRAWGFYGYRFQLYQNTQPHRGFQILKRWQTQAAKSGFVMTSNVDGHFQKAGFASEQAFECHGSIQYLQCCKPCNRKIWKINSLDFVIDPQNLLASGSLPLCPECGGVARPNILMFGDYNWLDNRADQQMENYYQWKQSVEDYKQVTIEIGAGSSVGGIRNSSQNRPGTLIRINPREAEGPKNTISIPMTALAALEAIDAVLNKF